MGIPPHNTLQKNSVNMLQDINALSFSFLCITLVTFFGMESQPWRVALCHKSWEPLGCSSSYSSLIDIVDTLLWRERNRRVCCSLLWWRPTCSYSEDCCLLSSECLAGVTMYYLTGASDRSKPGLKVGVSLASKHSE